jgi:molybdopterin molybdotransferase
VEVTDLAWAAARRTARAAQPLTRRALVPLDEAVGRTLSREVTAAAASPGTDTAAMDGYVVCGPGPWRIVGRLLAGGAPWGTPGEGEAAEIATGAVVPPGGQAVIPYEDCDADGGTVAGVLTGRRHIRYAGEDFPAGAVIAPAGRLVSGTVAAALAQSGVDAVWVYQRPAVWLIVTGDEVVASGVPTAGRVRDAHTAVVSALVDRAGGVLAGRVVIGDDPGALRDAVERAAVAADVVAVSGSSSAGRADHLRAVLAGAGGRWLVDGVRCRPGHPQGLGRTAGGRWVVSLPGNPFAGLVAGLTLLEPLVSSLAGREPADSLRLPVSGPARVYPDGVRLVPVTVAAGRAVVAAGSRPGSLYLVAQADAVAVIEPGWVDGMDAELLAVP